MIADEQLAEAERRVVMAAGTGQTVDLRVGQAQTDDPSHGATWDRARTVRAEVLIELLTAERAPENGRVRAIRIHGARIVGPLDLEARSLICPLWLRDCSIADPINLNEATAPAIRLPGCHVPALSATQLHTTGNLELDGGFTTGGEVNLEGAKIGGALSFHGASLINPGGRALSADGLSVEQGMSCRGGFTAAGEVRLMGARVGGQLSFTGASLANPGGRALSADGLTVEQGMFCQETFTAAGEVRLAGTGIGGVLSFDGASLANPSGKALSADGLTVEQNMFCRDGFRAAGEVDLLGAGVGGQLSFTGASLINPGGRALSADRLSVEQSMSCNDGFTAEGIVRLVGARVGGVLSFTGASLTNPGDQALSADGLSVEQSMFCRDGFTAAGEVNLLGAKIGGQLSFIGASLTNSGGRALIADRLLVEEDMFCQEGFNAEGQVRLLGARVGGRLSFTKATLNHPNGSVLYLESAVVADLFLLFASPPDGIVNLTNARTGAFHDEQATWPVGLRLRGFVYQTLENDRVRVRDRLRWLQRHRGYAPGIYDQLADAYRRGGHTEAARRVGVAKQWRRRSALNPANWLLYATVGYGYRTWLAAVWLTALAVLGTVVFNRAASHHLMRPGPNAPAFHAAAYALDLLVPIVDLGQRRNWTPHGSALYWSWLLIAAGWVLTTAAVAGLTGIFKRD